MMHIQAGLPIGTEEQAAALYWEAFGEKLGRVMGPHDKALAFIRRVLDPTHAISAVGPSGELLGVAGFKTHESALVGGSFEDMTAIYGWIGSVWRAVLVSFLERDTENERFLMDGIFVAPEARGKGVGSALLNGIMEEARKRGFESVRLDVIDTNPRARALYERHGFKAHNTSEMGLLAPIFRFESATTMVRVLQ
ncbi:MAG: GNAT family N-acetyltransferase [Pseudomonadota bacterium]